jgi:hypothetical protein
MEPAQPGYITNEHKDFSSRINDWWFQPFDDISKLLGDILLFRWWEFREYHQPIGDNPVIYCLVY